MNPNSTTFDASAFRFPRRGLTLVELLVVMVILTMITAATIPLLSPPGNARKIREAAREVATYLELARARAVETGRPAGIWIERLPGSGATGYNANKPEPVESNTMFLCETPPPYSGDTLNSTVQVRITAQPSAGNPQGTASLTFSPNDASLYSLVRGGDLIRFNFRGPYYRLGPRPFGQPFTSSDRITISWSALQDISPPQTNTGATTNPNAGVPFQIIRQPRKSAAPPVTLAGNVPFPIIDLTSSGIGPDNRDADFSRLADRDTATAGSVSWPLIITFAPSGRVDQVIYVENTTSGRLPIAIRPTAMIYLLTTLRREQEQNPSLRYLNAEAVWVAVNPSTGLVTVAEAVPPTPVTNAMWQGNRNLNDLKTSRELASGAKQAGGQ
ncbi:MAG: GspH/FimT family pseudopilin [Pirellulales bacterium]|nr:GspH/FimT family pseudopilin [Pirellulales bacterium]